MAAASPDLGLAAEAERGPPADFEHGLGDVLGPDHGLGPDPDRGLGFGLGDGPGLVPGYGSGDGPGLAPGFGLGPVDEVSPVDEAPPAEELAPMVEFGAKEERDEPEPPSYRRDWDGYAPPPLPPGWPPPAPPETAPPEMMAEIAPTEPDYSPPLAPPEAPPPLAQPAAPPPPGFDPAAMMAGMGGLSQMPPELLAEWLRNWNPSFDGAHIEVLGDGPGRGGDGGGGGGGDGGNSDDPEGKPEVVIRATKLCQKVDNYEAGFFYFMKNQYPDVPHLPPEPEGNWSPDSKATRDRLCHHCEAGGLDDLGSVEAAAAKFDALEEQFERAERHR